MESSLCQVPTQTFLVIWRNGLSDLAQGKAPQKQELNTCIWKQATSFFLETQPSAFRQGECGGEQRGRWKESRSDTGGRGLQPTLDPPTSQLPHFCS